ncbi:hypothetical protein Ancab_008248 [Ancistrocladus abbreviatus]
MMASDQVYPRDADSPPISGEHSHSGSQPVTRMHRRTMSQDSLMSKESYPYYDRSVAPPTGTYIVQVPKDQIYRVPPPENARKYQQYSSSKHRRNTCRCCICTTLLIILTLAFLIAVTGAVLYLVYRPKAPSYSVESVSIKGINLTSMTSSSSSALTISPAMDVTVRAENGNGKIGIYYEKGSDLSVYHNGVRLCDGSLPAFHQPPRNVSVVSMVLVGSQIVLSSAAHQTWLTEQSRGRVPLDMNVKIPVKIKVGAVKTWTITVKVTCVVTVNGLTANAEIVSKTCDVSIKPW